MQPSTKCQNGLGEFAQVQAGDKLTDPNLTAVHVEFRTEKRGHYHHIVTLIAP